MNIATYFKGHTLIIDNDYMICDGNTIRKVKFVHSTPRGFNFLLPFENKFYLKKHVYPKATAKILPTDSNILVFIPHFITIDEIQK